MRKANLSLEFVDQVPKWGKQCTGSSFFFLPVPPGKTSFDLGGLHWGSHWDDDSSEKLVNSWNGRQCLWSEEIIAQKVGVLCKENGSMCVRHLHCSLCEEGSRWDTHANFHLFLPWSLTILLPELYNSLLSLSLWISKHPLELEVTHWWLPNLTCVPVN